MFLVWQWIKHKVHPRGRNNRHEEKLLHTAASCSQSAKVLFIFQPCSAPAFIKRSLLSFFFLSLSKYIAKQQQTNYRCCCCCRLLFLSAHHSQDSREPHWIPLSFWRPALYSTIIRPSITSNRLTPRDQHKLLLLLLFSFIQVYRLPSYVENETCNDTTAAESMNVDTPWQMTPLEGEDYAKFRGVKTRSLKIKRTVMYVFVCLNHFF